MEQQNFAGPPRPLERREAEATLSRESAMWRESSMHTPVEQMQKMWLPTEVPRATRFCRPRLYLNKTFMDHVSIEPGVARLYSTLIRNILEKLPLSLASICLSTSRLYCQRLADFDEFTEDGEDPRCLHAFSTACVLASLFVALQRFVHLFNGWVPQCLDRFVLVAVEAPQSGELGRMLENDILPWFTHFERRKRYLRLRVEMERRTRKRDLRVWRGRDWDEEDFTSLSLSGLYSEGMYPSDRWPYGLHDSHVATLEYYRGEQYVRDLLDEYQEEYGTEILDDHRISLPDMLNYVPPPDGQPRDDDGTDMYLCHWVWKHQFNLQ